MITNPVTKNVSSTSVGSQKKKRLLFYGMNLELKPGAFSGSPSHINEFSQLSGIIKIIEPYKFNMIDQGSIHSPCS